MWTVSAWLLTFALEQQASGAELDHHVDGSGVAADLNRRFFGFNPQDDNSPLGVTMTTHSDFDVFCGTGCYHGHSDCRMSASLYNSRMMLTRDENFVKLGLDRRTGWTYHQDVVETYLHKCSYMFDGSSFHRYNGGCGCSAGSKCEEKFSAWGNVCKSTGENCNTWDHEVESCSCESRGLPDDVNSYQCFFKGPAMDSDNIDLSIDQLRWMTNTRESQQEPFQGMHHDPLEYWNELILDERLMLPMLQKDGASVVSAFIYKRGSHSSLRSAKRLRQEFLDQYPASVEIPLIAIDTNVDVTRADAVFFDDPTDDLELQNSTMV